ncbi:Diacylglycerol kinase catalytic domain-containing protein [Sphingomonas guangdongensis]|uniref:Diacylglycerol kinase catalytic domain-containing protein n=1 Tax=Sphingomonas guangdongensis TaxID=1141890 RepID=A0A285QYH9_9SPHN|nr:diacylglycerol kinase family protein [Sphingomonas guangdongensis]SOB87020.1 Diacylglycerol kinase catalytic domain-containing protein [Sphingomonas guangdongensis]
MKFLIPLGPTLPDGAATARIGADPAAQDGRLAPVSSASFHFLPDRARVGIISNPRSRRNQAASLPRRVGPGISGAAPTNADELRETLRHFADQRIELLVIDGGDGTVRDVLSAAAPFFGDELPAIALSPSGKTNALALDLGVPLGWGIDDAIAAWGRGNIGHRAPIEIERPGGSRLFGFIFGAGAFVRATALAQRTHRWGAIDGLAVGLSLAGALGQTFFGGRDNPWRKGDHVTIVNTRSGVTVARDFYILFGSTLQRLPLGLRVLGRPGPGLNVLAVDAPPRNLPLSALGILAGREGGRLAQDGVHHGHDIPPTELTLDHGFILDGEHFAGGTVTVRAGRAIRFVMP